MVHIFQCLCFGDDFTTLFFSCDDRRNETSDAGAVDDEFNGGAVMLLNPCLNILKRGYVGLVEDDEVSRFARVILRCHWEWFVVYSYDEVSPFGQLLHVVIDECESEAGGCACYQDVWCSPHF